MPPITPDGRSDARPSSWLLFPQSLGTAVLSPIAEGCFHPRCDAGGFNAALPVETRQSCFANGLTLCCLGNCLSPFHPTCWCGALVGARQGVWGCGGAGVQPPHPCAAPRCCFPSLQDFTPIGALQVPRNCSTASKRGCFLGKNKKKSQKKKRKKAKPSDSPIRAPYGLCLWRRVGLQVVGAEFLTQTQSLAVTLSPPRPQSQCQRLLPSCLPKLQA